MGEDEDKIIGYLMCYENKSLKQIISSGKIDHQDGIVTYLQTQNNPYIFGDHIAIGKRYLQTGVGHLLMKRLFKDMKKNKIPKMYVGVLHGPVKNTPSINFIKALGFRFLKEVKNKDKLSWGIYGIKV